MRRIVLWFLGTVATVVLLFGYPTSTAGPLAGGPTSPYVSGTTPGSVDGSGTRTVTGDTVQTEWGPVQVQVTLEDATIIAVEVLQHPDGNPRDVEINDAALPVLVDETLEAQGTDIDMVSGATVTSAGYVQSLQSALDEAGL